ncbi:CocE/NonD family hydrolase [Shouchella patagoniensis]|uniref:CocE/NonD family hydrolase n=1 Tax=Shouchella patagoniensis TaxID=228576 RepID=UPI0009955AA4|nr:CocE/NonD family hydrolase [Shouchella patagoniensis]
MDDTIIIEKNQVCIARDGTKLYCDIYRPHDDGKYPILIKRLLDGKDSCHYHYLDLQTLVLAGYIVLIQDVRGRYKSEGSFYPLHNEQDDGYDTIEWAASLPFSNGKIGMYGEGYSGFTQLAAASANPPHLQAVFPIQTFTKLNEITHDNGIFKLEQSVNWALLLSKNEITRINSNHDTKRDLLFHWQAYTDNITQFYSYRPMMKLPVFKMLHAGNYFYSFIQEGRSSLDVNKTIPSFFVSGWYDVFLQSTLKAFQDASAETNTPHTLLIGPWAHNQFTNIVGERSFGHAASIDSLNQEISFTNLHLRWFDRWLKEHENGIEEEAPIYLFVMGINKWRKEKQWPPDQTESLTLFFHHSDNGRHLSLEEARSFQDELSYDPNKPVPTHGGSLIFEPIIGPRDQRIIQTRNDVLVYKSHELEHPIEVIGAATLNVEIEIDVSTSDLTAKLLDICPDGTSYNLCDGIIELHHHGGAKMIQLKLPPTANQFKKGHRIGIELSASNFPQYTPNSNTGEDRLVTKDVVKAKLMFTSSNEHKATLSLPIAKNPLM